MSLSKHSTKYKVAADLLYEQVKWTLWYIPIVIILYFVSRLIPQVEINNISFAAAMVDASKIYMLVIGIFTFMAFIAYYVRNGITRKDYFIGSALASIGVAIGILAFTFILNAIFRLFGWTAAVTDIGLNTTSAWLLFIYLVFIFVSSYVAGWIIGVGFVKFGGWGVLFIPAGILISSLTELVWGMSVIGPVTMLNISFPQLSPGLALAITVAMIVTGLILIRTLTKDIIIKD